RRRKELVDDRAGGTHARVGASGAAPGERSRARYEHHRPRPGVRRRDRGGRRAREYDPYLAGLPRGSDDHQRRLPGAPWARGGEGRRHRDRVGAVLDSRADGPQSAGADGPLARPSRAPPTARLPALISATAGAPQFGRAQRGGYLVHLLQLRVRPWQGAGHREQRVVSDDAERRPVLLRRHRLAPAIQLPQRRQLARWQHLRTLDAEKRVRAAAVRGPGPAQVLETGELLFGPREPLQSREAGAQRLAQRRQVLRVGGGERVDDRRQRRARPVGLLVLLGELHAHVLFEQRGEPDRWLARELGGDTGVEQPARPEAVVAVQDPQVVVGIVEDLLDLRVIEQPAHGREVGDRERVDDRRQRRAR